MHPERFAVWRAALQTRDQAMLLLGLLVLCGVLNWLAWGRETPQRQRLMLAGWWLLVTGLVLVGLVALP